MRINTTSDYRLGYRGDVEGLRAVAILLVVACHAKVPWLAGGFVGVDVFYVLSGYLISGLLIQEIETTGCLNFANFYARRQRRLMPALLLMLAVVCVLARLLLAADSQPGQALAATSAALWLSNFHFAFAQMNYFAPGAETNLFLHTWSLGVEEQFYLVWPLLIALAVGAWAGARRKPVATRLKYVFGMVFVAAMALSLYWTWHAPRLAFYMMPSRAWQFALGALVFLLVGSPNFHGDRRPWIVRWSIPASWLGVALIIASALLINGSVPYPGYWAILPTTGAALVLAGGGSISQRDSINHWLALRPAQAVGRVSYSWYLWHWPVLLLGAQLIDARNGWNRLLLVVLSLAIAAASYHFFETPIRHNHRLIAKPRMAVFVALAIMVLAGSFALRWRGAAQARLKDPTQLAFAAAHFDAPVIYRMGCDDWYHSAEVRVCSFGDPHATHTVVAVGDSVALQWFPAYARVFDRPGWRLLIVTKSSCPMVNVPLFYPRIGREYTVCAEWRQAAIRKIVAMQPDVIIMGSTFTYDYTRAQWIDGTRSVLARLAPAARSVYVMRSTPTLPFDAPSCVAPRSWLYSTIKGATLCTAPAQTVHSEDVFHWLQAAAAPFDNVHMIDMTSAVCPHDVCHAEIDGKVVFRDNQHMTGTFAASLAPELARKLGISLPAADTRTTAVTRSPTVAQSGFQLHAKSN